jgi:hypothetical protein
MSAFENLAIFLEESIRRKSSWESLFALIPALIGSKASVTCYRKTSNSSAAPPAGNPKLLAQHDRTFSRWS